MSKNADYSKQQLKSAAIFAEAVSSFGEKVEMLQASKGGGSSQKLSAIKSAASAISSSVAELASNPVVVRKFEAEADKDSIYMYLRTSQMGWLALLSFLFGEKVEPGNIQSYVDKALKPPTDKGAINAFCGYLQELQQSLLDSERTKNNEEEEKRAKEREKKAVEVTIKKFLDVDSLDEIKDSLAIGAGGSNEGAGYLTASSKGIAAMADVLNKYNFGDATKKLKPLKNFLEEFANMMQEFSSADPKNKEKVENYVKFIEAIDLTNTAVLGFINNIDEVALSEKKAVKAIETLKGILDKMIEVMPDQKELDTIKEQSISLSTFFENLKVTFENYAKTIEIIGTPGMVVRGVLATWSIRIAGSVLKVMHNKLAPAAKDVVEDKSSLEGAVDSLLAARDIFKSLAVISIASVPIVLFFPLTFAALFLAKILIKRIIKLAKTLKDNEKEVVEGVNALKPLGWIVVGTLALGVGAVLIGKLKPAFDDTVIALGVLLACLFGLSGAFILLGKFVKPGGTAAVGLKSMLALVLGTVLLALGIVGLTYIINEDIWKGVLFVLSVLFGIALAYGIMAFLAGPGSQAEKGVNAMKWLIFGTIILCVFIVIISHFIDETIIKGVLLALGIMFGIAGAMCLLSLALKMLPADFGKRAITLFLLALGLTLIVVMIAVVVKPEHIKGIGVAGLGILMILGTVLLVNLLLNFINENNFGVRALKVFGIVLGIAILVTALAKIIKPEDIKGLTVAGIGILGVLGTVLLINWLLNSIDENNFGKKALKVFGLCLGIAVLVTALAKILKLEDLLGLVVFGIGVLLVIGLMKLLVFLMPDEKKTMAAIGIVIMFLLAAIITIGIIYIASQIAQNSWGVILGGMGLMILSFAIVLLMIWGIKFLIKLISGGKEGLAAASDLLMPLLIILIVLFCGLVVIFAIQKAGEIALANFMSIILGIVCMLGALAIVILMPAILNLLIKVVTLGKSGVGALMDLLWPMAMVLIIVLVAAAVMGFILIAGQKATMSWEQLLKGMLILAASLAITYLLFWLLSKIVGGNGGGIMGKLFKGAGPVGQVAGAVAGKKKGGVWGVIKNIFMILVVVIIAMGTLMLCCWAGKLFTWELIFKGLILALGLGVIVGSFYLLQKAIERVKWFKLFGALILIAAMLVGLILLLIWIDLVLNWGMLSPVTLLGLIIVALAGLMILLDKMNKNKGIDRGFILLSKIVLGMLEMSVGFYALAYVAEQYNMEKYFAVSFMCGVVYLLGLICVKLDKLNKNGGVNKGLLLMAEILLAILGMAVAFGVLAFVALMFTLPVYIAAGFMVLVLGLMGLMAFGLGALDKAGGLVTAGALVLIALAAAFLIASLGLIAMAKAVDMFSKIKVPAWGDIARLGVFVLGIIAGAAAAGAASPLIILGSVAMLMWSGAMLLLSGVSAILINITKDLKQKQLDLLFDLIGGLIKAGCAAGLAFPLLLLGSIALGIFSVAVVPFCGAVWAAASASNLATPQTVKQSKDLKTIVRNVWNAGTQFGMLDLIEGASKASRVASVTGDIGEAISKIAKAVQDYAELKVPKAWDSKGNPTSYRQLTQADFKNAANGVSKIVTTVGGALIKLYYQAPEMFLSGWFSSSPFTKVAESCLKMGPMISKIAQGVADYAALKVPEEWDKDGNPTKYKHLSPADFVKAGISIKSIVLTVGLALIKLYKGNEYMFDSGWFSDSPFTKVMKGTTNMGNLISELAKGIQLYANLKYPTKWDKTGKAIDFKTMQPGDFAKASMNIRTIILGIAETLVSVYEKNRDLFDTGRLSLILLQCAQMGYVIAALAAGVFMMSALQIPVYEGNKIVKRKKLTEKDFTAAAVNTSILITCLVCTLNNVYQKYGYLFEGAESGFLGIGAKDNPIGKITKGMTEVCKMLGNLANTVKQYATNSIPIYVNGKFDHYEQITTEDYVAMAFNVSFLVLCLANTLSTLYWDNWGFFNIGTNDKTPVQKVCEGVNNMSNSVSNIAKAVKDIAAALFPVYKNGKFDHYEKLTPVDYVMVGINVSLLVTCLATSLENLYNKHQKLFEPPLDENGEPTGDSALAKIMKCIDPMAKFIGTIADSVIKFASGTYDKYNSKGKKIGKVNIGPADYIKAGISVALVITCIITALANLALGKVGDKTDPLIAEIFKSDDIEESPLGKIFSIASQVGGLISLVADGVIKMSMGDIYERDDKGRILKHIHIGPETFVMAALNTSMVISCLIYGLYNLTKSPEYAYMTQKVGDDDDMRIEQVIEVATNVIGLLGVVGEAVRDMAQLKFKNAKGKEVQLETKHFAEAGFNAALAITCILDGLFNSTAMKYTSKQLEMVPEIASTACESMTTVATHYSTIMDVLKESGADMSIFAKMVKGNFSPNAEIDISNDGTVVALLKGVFSYVKNVKSFMDAIQAVMTGKVKFAGMFANIGGSFSSSSIEDLTDNLSKILSAVIRSINKLARVAVRFRIKSLVKYTSNSEGVNTLFGDITNFNAKLNAISTFKFDITALKRARLALKQTVKIVNIFTFVILQLRVYIEIAKTLDIKEKEVNGKKVTVFDQIFDTVLSFINSLTQFLFSPPILYLTLFKDRYFGGVKKEGSIRWYMNNIIQIIYYIKYSINRIARSGLRSYESIQEKITTYFSDLNILADELKKSTKLVFDDSVLKRYNQILWLMNGGNNKVGGEETMRLAQGVVKAINTLDINKTNIFIRLLQELNMLGQRMGGLDKLTKAIADTLSSELSKLTFEISRSEFVINNADKIQEARAQRISDLIDEVRELISLPIEVRPVIEDEEGGSSGSYSGSISGVNDKNYNLGVTFSSGGSSGSNGTYYTNNVNTNGGNDRGLNPGLSSDPGKNINVKQSNQTGG